MDHPIVTPLQAKAVLRALRRSKGLNQSQLGRLLGVNQQRIAKIESDPGATSFDQISRLVSALGARIVIQTAPSNRVDELPAPRVVPDGEDW